MSNHLSLQETKSHFRNRVNGLIEHIASSLRDLLRQGAEPSPWKDYAGDLELRLAVESICRDFEELITLSFEIQVLTTQGNLPQIMSEIDHIETSVQNRIGEINDALEKTAEITTRALQDRKSVV